MSENYLRTDNDWVMFLFAILEVVSHDCDELKQLRALYDAGRG